MNKRSLFILHPSSFILALCVVGLTACPRPAAGAGAGERPEDDISAAPSYDEVVYALIGNLGRDSATAQDAAFKLARLGKRAVPALAEVFKANLVAAPPAAAPAPEAKAKEQLAYFAALALSRIKSTDAAKLLLPLLNNEKASSDMRALALEAYGLELVPEGAAALHKVVASDPDFQMRKKAFAQLSLMPNFWVQSEKLVVGALSDPDDEIRALAAKQCWYAHIYLSAADRLIELAEKDTSSAVRSHALLALSRMKVPKAVPAVVRICLQPDLGAAEQKQALYVLSQLAGVSPKDAAAVQAWWKKAGEAEYGKYEAPAQAPEVKARPETLAPDRKPSP